MILAFFLGRGVSRNMPPAPGQGGHPLRFTIRSAPGVAFSAGPQYSSALGLSLGPTTGSVAAPIVGRELALVGAPSLTAEAGTPSSDVVLALAPASVASGGGAIIGFASLLEASVAAGGGVPNLAPAVDVAAAPTLGSGGVPVLDADPTAGMVAVVSAAGAPGGAGAADLASTASVAVSTGTAATRTFDDGTIWVDGTSWAEGPSVTQFTFSDGAGWAEI